MKINHPNLRVFAMLLFALMLSIATQAQNNLKINSIFEKYGKKKGATMTVLSGEALNNYQLDKYRSITLKCNESIMDEIQRCLDADKKQALQINEVVSNGIITSGYYRLSEENKNINRYILFKIGNDETATLIYMEGGKDSEELIRKLFVKKKQN
jgi:hypothetical protein